MSAVSIVPAALLELAEHTAHAEVATVLAASRSVVLRAGEPCAHTVDSYLACDEVETFAARDDLRFAAARWGDGRLELWCRGDVTIAAGDRVIAGCDELHHEAVEMGTRARIDVAMWLGVGPRPEALGATVYRACVGAVPAVACAVTVVADAPVADPIDELFGPTVARDVEAAAVRPEVVSNTGAALAVMLFSSGERVVIDRTTVIGRRPTAVVDTSSSAGSPQRLVALASASLSRQHAVVRLDRWCATIEDLGSANGTSVAHGDVPPTALQPKTPIDLIVGSHVVLGGDTSFVVEALD